jgi:hypothetical protein
LQAVVMPPPVPAEPPEPAVSPEPAAQGSESQSQNAYHQPLLHNEISFIESR